jgi:hypothetical protein
MTTLQSIGIGIDFGGASIEIHGAIDNRRFRRDASKNFCIGKELDKDNDVGLANAVLEDHCRDSIRKKIDQIPAQPNPGAEMWHFRSECNFERSQIQLVHRGSPSTCCDVSAQ